jgi:hypothetical protein
VAAGFAAVIAGRGSMTAGDIDAVAFHAAARLALEGRCAAAWKAGLHAAARAASLAAVSREYPFLHPPPALLIVLPFGIEPVFAAFPASTVPGLAAVAMAWRAQGLGRGLLLPALLAPAVIIQGVHGRTGFLMLAALARVGISLDRRPWLVGIRLAILALKPHFGPLVLRALLAARCGDPARRHGSGPFRGDEPDRPWAWRLDRLPGPVARAPSPGPDRVS